METKSKVKSSLFDVLKYKDFKYMWLAQIFSQTALNILTFALVLHLFALTGKATSISLVMIASAIPVAIFGPVSGVLADKLNFRKILLYTNFLRFLVTILFLFADSNILALLEIIFIISALSQIFTPAESSSVPLIVEEKRLISANSLIMSTTYATLLVGYSIAGPLLGLVGPNWLFFACGILYLIATWFTNKLSNYDNKTSKKLTIENLAKGIDHVWDEIIFSIKYLRGNKKINEPMMKLTIGWTVLGAFITLIPAYGESVLKISPKFIGPLVVAPAGLGMIIATSFLNRKNNQNYLKSINKGFIIVAFSLVIFTSYYLYQNLIISKIILIVLLMAMGFGSSLVQVSAQTLLHLNSDGDKRGRVFGLSSMQLRLATSLPALVIGGISDLTSPFVTMILLATTVFIYSLILLFD